MVACTLYLGLIAVQGKLDPVVGRKKEIERVTQILGRRTKNNPCLIGEPGVGKTAVAEGLAQKIATGDCPETIEGKQVMPDIILLLRSAKITWLMARLALTYLHLLLLSALQPYKWQHSGVVSPNSM